MKMQLLALCLVRLFIGVTAQTVYYVKPNSTSQGCPGIPCLTLDQYARQESYFTTGAIFLFMAGNHSLDTTISIKNISDIIFRKDGNGSDVEVVTLLCKTELIIRCENVTNFKLEEMTIILYAGNTAHGEESPSALSVFDSKEVLFLGLEFHGRSDLLIRAVICNHSDVTIANCLFEGNAGFEGGAVYASNGSNITLSGDVFIGNHAVRSGGAIFAYESSLTLKGSNFTHTAYAGGCMNSKTCTASDAVVSIGSKPNLSKHQTQYCGGVSYQRTQFSSNEAKYGGAIYLQHSVATLDGTETVFHDNSGFVGGAIFSYNSAVTSNTTCLCFNSNRAQLVGGGYFGNHSSLKLGDPDSEASNHHFENNSATMDGGAVHFQYGSLSVAGNSRFIQNRLTEIGFDNAGGAVYGLSGNLTLCGRASLAHNSAGSGGAIYIIYSHIDFGGTVIEFANNLAHGRGGFGGAVAISTSEMLITTEQLNFVNNSIPNGIGGGIQVFRSGLQVSNRTEQINFLGNSAGDGGGIHCQEDSTVTLHAANFVNNSAWNTGGAIVATQCNARYRDINVTGCSKSGVFSFRSNVSFVGHTRMSDNTGDAGAVLAEMSSISFDGVTIFESNAAHVSGGAVNGLTGTNLSFSGHTSFLNNTAVNNGGAVYIFIKTQMLLSGVTVFQNNAAHVYGGAIFAYDAHLILNNTVNFTSNRGDIGGALFFQTGAKMTLMENTILSTSHNHATEWGGAIFNMDSITFDQCNFSLSESWNNSAAILVLPDCFLDLKGIVLDDNSNTAPYRIQSYNDSARIDGSFMFGGLTDKCRIVTTNNHLHRIAWDLLYTVLMERNILDIRTYDRNTTRAIASEAFLLCFCHWKRQYNCSKSISVRTYRGRKFSVLIVALSQGDTIMSVDVSARISQTARLRLNQNSQVLPQRNCSSLSYNMYSTEVNETLILYPRGSCRDTGLAQAIVNVTFLPCPDAFVLSSDSCICEPRLQAYDAKCTILDDEIFIVREAGSKFWMSALNSNGTYQGLILYRTCPTQYCKTKLVNITLDQTDVQCNTHRTRLLCGACATNYSLMLGGSKCELCSNQYLSLLIAFAAAGLVLVAFLSFLRLTIATGMLNSIILYANIVQANRDLFFPSTTNILTVFIAWMNLDLGFETCFYHGMDAYAQTWLQFAFPVYVWALISVIILTSRYSTIMTKLIGTNPIAVLATLLLMSYTKILKIIIEIYSSVKLDYPDNTKVTVWLKDANVPYLTSKHLTLALVASLFVVFLFLPYTLFLLLGHKLYRFSGGKYFRWLKPFLDSHYAPYEKHTRYWTGLLLLVRCALYFVFSFNSLGGTNTSLLAITIAFTALIVIAWLSVKIYSNFYTNAIEAFAYLNLIVLSATRSSDITSPALVNTLVGIVFATMMGVAAYHFHLLYIAKSKTWHKVVAKLTSVVGALKRRMSAGTAAERAPLVPPPPSSSSHDPHKIVTKSVINLREQLLTDEYEYTGESLTEDPKIQESY